MENVWLLDSLTVSEHRIATGCCDRFPQKRSLLVSPFLQLSGATLNRLYNDAPRCKPSRGKNGDEVATSRNNVLRFPR